MLAGVVLELCLAPVRGFAAHPWQVGPILLTWLVLLRFARKWAVPAAFARHASGGRHRRRPPGRPARLAAPAPGLDDARPHLGGLLGLALPLYVVTMAGPERARRRDHVLLRVPGAVAGDDGRYRHRHRRRRAGRRSRHQPGRDHRLDGRVTRTRIPTRAALGRVLHRGLGLPRARTGLDRADHVRQRRAGRRDQRRGRPRPPRHPLVVAVGRPVGGRRTRGGGDHVRGRGVRADLPRHRRRLLGSGGRPAGAGGAAASRPGVPPAASPRARRWARPQVGRTSARLHLTSCEVLPFQAWVLVLRRATPTPRLDGRRAGYRPRGCRSGCCATREELGLVTPARTAAGHRRYGPGEITRLYQALALRRPACTWRRSRRCSTRATPSRRRRRCARTWPSSMPTCTAGLLRDRLAAALGALDHEDADPDQPAACRSTTPNC